MSNSTHSEPINIQELEMCRICVRENCELQLIVGSHLQAVYEHLTMRKFESKDRPLKVCLCCSEKLNKCYRLLQRCLQGEEIYSLMVNMNASSPADLREVLQSETVRACLEGLTPPESSDSDEEEMEDEDDFEPETTEEELSSD